jgi:tetratricopeptide (TPR) repeat protein
MTVGVTFAEAGDRAAARPFLEASMLAFRELGDEYYTGVAAENVAWVVHGLGDKHRARALLEENLERARALNNRRHEMIAIDGLAIFARDDGRLEEALLMLGEVLKFTRELGDRLELAIGLGRLAEVLALAGESYRAACLLASSEALTEEIDARTPWWAAERNEKTASVIRERLDEYVFDQAWGQGAKLSLEERAHSPWAKLSGTRTRRAARSRPACAPTPMHPRCSGKRTLAHAAYLAFRLDARVRLSPRHDADSSTSQPTSRAGHRRLRAEPHRDWARRSPGSRGPSARPRSLATYQAGRAPRPIP